MQSFDDIVNEVVTEHNESLATFDSIYSIINDIILIPKQVLANLSSCVEHIQKRDTASTLDSLEEVSIIIQSLNSKIIKSIQLLKSGESIEGN